MLTVVVYGAAPEDRNLLRSLQNKLKVIFEPRPLSDDNLHSNADVIAIFSDSIVKPGHITPHLKAVISRSTGIDHIKCVDQLVNRKIPIFQPKGYATKSVARYSFNIINEEFQESLKRLNVVIVGAGAIGRCLQDLLLSRNCPSILVSASGMRDTIPYSQLQDCVGVADVICLHSSLRVENTKMFNNFIFSHMKKGAILINAARGQIVDNRSLLDALDAGKLRRAYLDLVDADEYRTAVLDHRNVIFTNYTAWKSEESLRASQDFLLQTLKNLAEI